MRTDRIVFGAICAIFLTLLTVFAVNLFAAEKLPDPPATADPFYVSTLATPEELAIATNTVLYNEEQRTEVVKTILGRMWPHLPGSSKEQFTHLREYTLKLLRMSNTIRIPVSPNDDSFMGFLTGDPRRAWHINNQYLAYGTDEQWVERFVFLENEYDPNYVVEILQGKTKHFENFTKRFEFARVLNTAGAKSKGFMTWALAVKKEADKEAAAK